ncbi:MAG: Gfo/Idh/MocA family protein [Terriglobia bacterium]
MINLGIAGMGYIGQVHLDASRKVPGVQVLAVATLEPEKIRDTFSGQIYSTYAELLRDDRLDAVVIGLPTDLHEKAVVMAAECGRHILCEKSMALDAASARRMLQAAQAHDRIFMVAHVLRFWPQYARIKELIDAGEIGSVISATAYRLSKFPPWMVWFRDPARSGGTLLDLQVHDVDFVHWILGHPQSVYTVGTQSPTGSWDHVHTILNYPHAQASIEASSLMPQSFPFSTRILVVGTEGALEYTFRVATNVQDRDSASHFFRLYKNDGGESEPTASAEDAYVAQFRYFAQCVAERQQPRLCPPEESCQVMQVMSALRQSADTGRVVAID